MTDRELLELLLQKVTGMDERIVRVEQSQIRMESELTDKVRALYDAREVQNGVNAKIFATLENLQQQINERFDNIDKKIEEVDAKLDVLHDHDLKQEVDIRLLQKRAK